MTLAEKLIGRITAREHKTCISYVLNLRGQRWGYQRQKTIRRQDHPDWPDKGSTVDTRQEAEELMDAYAEWLAPLLERTAATAKQTKRPQARRLTWKLAIAAFLAAIEGVRPRNTVSSYRVSLQKHVQPRWGDHALTLDPEEVGPWINDIQAEKRGNGKVWYDDAAPTTKSGILDAMRACFRHHFPNHEPTFAGVTINDLGDKHATRLANAEAGVIASPEVAHTVHDLRATLVQAAINDYLGITNKPNVKTAIANTPDAIAWQVGTLTRISELMFVRWYGYRGAVGGPVVPMIDLDRADGVLYVPGTKTVSAPRWIVIFDALRPWIDRARLISLSPVDSRGFVFQTPGREPTRAPAVKTYSNRMTKAQILAGVKKEGEATHIFRSTGATPLYASAIEESKIKLLLGHAPYSGATARYADAEKIVAQLPRDVRTYLDDLLPHPADVFAEASARLQALGHDVVLDPFPARQD